MQIKVGKWIAKPTLNLLENDKQSIRLEPRAMEMLVFLAHHPGEVLSADQLIATLWKGRVTEDASVYKRINQLRKALGDDARAPRYIETIPKRGYRLIATVEIEDLTHPRGQEKHFANRLNLVHDDGFEGPQPQIHRRLSRSLIAIITLATASLVLVSINFLVTWYSGAPTLRPNFQSIAVLPFTNISNDFENSGIFADAMHDVLLAHLAKIKDLKVISRASVMTYRDNDTPPREIGNALNVATILEGTVQKVGDNIRINVQLIDSQTEEYLWAELYDRQLTAQSLFSIQTEMATSIASTLQAVLSSEETAQLSLPVTKNIRAYEFYLLGEEYMKRVPNKSWTSLASQMYTRAISEDPEFALAWAALSRANIVAYDNNFPDPSGTLLLDAQNALDRAVALAPGSPEVRLAMARYYQGIGDYDSALREFEIAERNLPGGSYLYRSRANVYQKMGDFSRAVADMNKAIKLDPLNIEQLEAQATSYVYLRDYRQAGLVYDRILEIRPDLASAFIDRFVWLPLVEGGKFELARDALTNPLTEDADVDERCYVQWLTALYARDYETAMASLANWEPTSANPAFEPSPVELLRGLTYELLGKPNLARQEFEKARRVILAKLANRPEDPRLRISLAQALAGLGDLRAATNTVSLALDSLASTTQLDAFSGPTYSVIAATVLIATGNHEKAIDQLQAYLSAPGQWSLGGILLDPRFDLIRGHPRLHAAL